MPNADVPETDIPNPAANKEKAEGSRPEERGAGTGITNRPIETEQHEQGQVTPRGQKKEGGHA